MTFCSMLVLIPGLEVISSKVEKSYSSHWRYPPGSKIWKDSHCQLYNTHEVLFRESTGSLTQHVHEIFENWRWIVVLNHSEEETHVYEIVLPFEVFRDGFQHIKPTQCYIVRQPFLGGKLVHRNVESVKMDRRQLTIDIDKPYPGTAESSIPFSQLGGDSPRARSNIRNAIVLFISHW